MKTKTITVTQQHIKMGVKHSFTKCPIALALKAQCAENRILVYRHYATVNDAAVRLPLIATAFIQDFDHQRGVEPFTFDVELW